jgi:hypothetical protein
MKGSGSRAGFGSIRLTSGSGSGRPKNTWIRWIRNSGKCIYYFISGHPDTLQRRLHLCSHLSYMDIALNSQFTFTKDTIGVYVNDKSKLVDTTSNRSEFLRKIKRVSIPYIIINSEVSPSRNKIMRGPTLLFFFAPTASVVLVRSREMIGRIQNTAVVAG